MAVILRRGHENQRSVRNVSFNVLNGHWCIEESTAVAEKLHGAVVKFDTYWNVKIYNASGSFACDSMALVLISIIPSKVEWNVISTNLK